MIFVWMSCLPSTPVSLSATATWAAARPAFHDQDGEHSRREYPPDGVWRVVRPRRRRNERPL